MNVYARQIMGDRVRKTREYLGISKVEFSLAAGISRPFLDQIESGKANPSLETLINVAGALGMTVSDLLEGVR